MPFSGTVIGKSGTDHRGQYNGCYQDHTICGDPDTSVHGRSMRPAAVAACHIRVVGLADNSQAVVVAVCHSRVVGLADNSPVVVVVVCHSRVVGLADNSQAVVVDDHNQADHSTQNCRRRNERPEQWMPYHRKGLQ